jgi:hypothetical protein
VHYYFPATQQHTATSNQATVEMVTSDNDGSQSQAVAEQPVPEMQAQVTTNTNSVPESGISNQFSVEVVFDVQPNSVNDATVSVHEEPPASNDQMSVVIEPDLSLGINSDNIVTDGHVSFAQIISSSSVKSEKRVGLKRRRMVQHAAIVTSSPYKTQIEEMKSKEVTKKVAKEKSKSKGNEKKSSVVKTGRPKPACSGKKKRECSTT